MIEIFKKKKRLQLNTDKDYLFFNVSRRKIWP